MTVTNQAQPVPDDSLQWAGFDAPDEQIRALVEAVKPDWAAIDGVWDELRRGRGLHLRRDADLDGRGSRSFLYEAFAVAKARNLLEALAARLIKADLVHPPFVRALDGLLGPGPAALEAFQDGARLPVSAVLNAKGLMLAIEHVCRIDIDDTRGVGTGVLVRPTLVATAAHVIWKLLACNPDGEPILRADGSLQAAPGSLKRLTLTFGDVEDYLPQAAARAGGPAAGGAAGAPPPPATWRLAGEVAALHENWLAWGSPATTNERSPVLFNVLNIDGIDTAIGPWDVALIRLAKPRPLPQPNLRTQQSPRQPFDVNVLHHPNGGSAQGQPLMLSTGRIDEQLGTPPVRVLHDANTVAGSSGAPVYDRRWRIVALHQGGARSLVPAPPVPAAQGQAHQAGRNRAVPVTQWCTRVEEIEKLVEAPFLTQLLTATDLSPQPYPVIGRQETQRRIRAAAEPLAPLEQRLLIVRGEPGTGRRFTKRLVRELLSGLGHRIGAIDLANAVDDDAAQLARRCASALSLTSATSSEPVGLTTAQRVLRDDVVPGLVSELAALGEGQQAWLVLEGFDATGEIVSTVRDLVLTLLRELGHTQSLRLVLAGWPEAPPPGFELAVEELTRPTPEDISLLFTLAGSEVDPALVEVATTLLAAQEAAGWNGYQAAHPVVAQLKLLLSATLARPGGAS